MKYIIAGDDEPHIVEGVRHLRRAADRQIQTVSSGRAALDLIEEQIPDLLIVDIMMPEMSGLEVVSTLRANEATRGLPIIILTAKGQAQDAAMAQEVWGTTVVAKPFDPTQLRRLVTATLENRECPQTSST